MIRPRLRIHVFFFRAFQPKVEWDSSLQPTGRGGHVRPCRLPRGKAKNDEPRLQRWHVEARGRILRAVPPIQIAVLKPAKVSPVACPALQLRRARGQAPIAPARSKPAGNSR